MKIPKDAKIVFKGIMFEIYHWQQKMFDGSYQTYEIAKRKNTVEVIPVIDGKIWVAEQEQPTKSLCFSLFGGRQDGEEKPIETAKRELLEEAGLESEDWESLWEFNFSEKIKWDLFVYIARNCKKVAEQKLDKGGEKITIKKVNFEEFLEIVENDKFWGKPFQDFVFRIKQDKQKLEEFRNKIFG